MNETLPVARYDTQTDANSDMREVLDLPPGFKTEKGSVY